MYSILICCSYGLIVFVNELIYFFYKYLTKQNKPKHKSARLSIRPAGPAPDLNYFRNKVSHLLKLVYTYMYFSGPMLGFSSYILEVSIKVLLQIDCSLSYSEN